MAELQQLIQSSNGAFQSELMKSFVAQHKGNFPSSPATTTSTTSPSTNHTGAANITDNANILNQNDNNDNDNRNITNANLKQQQKENATTPTIVTSTTSPPASPSADPNANLSEVAAIFAEVTRKVPEAQAALVRQVGEATTQAHLATCGNTHAKVSEARARLSKEMQGGEMGGLGGMPDLSQLSLKAGGMWDKMMAQMMPEVGKAIKFCKMMPGFSEVCLEDQMRLVKAASFEVMMTRFAMLIDHEHETMLEPGHNMICPRAVVKAMPMGGFLDGFFAIGAAFNPVGLTDGEVGLFTALQVLSPSRPGLRDTKLLAQLHKLYLRAFFQELKENHSDAESVLRQALGLLPMFARINAEHSKALGGMMASKGPDAFDKTFPPLHKEIYLEKEQ